MHNRWEDIIKSENGTFGGFGPTWAIAAVGDNGDPNYLEYAKGFSAAANLLLDEIIKAKGLKFPADLFVYPICFNMRHSVELRLKHTVVNLQRIASIKKTELDTAILGSHDIGKIWDFVIHQALKLDKRYATFIKELNVYIVDIADVDPTGQTFRYPYNQESVKHLTGVSTINLVLLRERFSELEKIMDELFYFNEFLVEEYSLGSFTTHLSRADLFEIASRLPPVSSWVDPTFDITRNSIKEEFQISGNELSTAINLVKNNYETALLISAPQALTGITLENFYDFFYEWFKLHDLQKMNESLEESFSLSAHNPSDFEEMSKFSQIATSSAELLSAKFSPEPLAVLNALYYFSGEWKFSESYYYNFQLALERFIQEKSHISVFKQSVRHLLNKPKALDAILQSLYFLGNSELASNIIKKYNLVYHLPWIESAINRRLFKKPDLWGYKEHY